LACRIGIGHLVPVSQPSAGSSFQQRRLAASAGPGADVFAEVVLPPGPWRTAGCGEARWHRQQRVAVHGQLLAGAGAGRLVGLPGRLQRRSVRTSDSATSSDVHHFYQRARERRERPVSLNPTCTPMISETWGAVWRGVLLGLKPTITLNPKPGLLCGAASASG
jgi:hypothetical protein